MSERRLPLLMLLSSLALWIAATAVPASAQVGGAKAEWKKRVAAVDKDDPGALWKLAEWAIERGLPHEADRTCKRIIKLDPDHAPARDRLGWVLAGDAWVKKTSPEGRAVIAAEAAMKADDPDAGGSELDFTALVAGWTEAQRAADDKMAARLSAELAEDVIAISSRNVAIKGPFERELVLSALRAGERAHAGLNELMGWPWNKKVVRAGHGQRLQVLFCLNEGSFELLLNWINKNYHPMDQVFMRDLMEAKRGLAARAHMGVTASFVKDGLDLTGYVLHHLGQTYVDTVASDANPWLWEGFGIYTSVRFHGKNSTHCYGQTRYANERKEERRGDDQALALLVKEMAATKSFRPFKRLFELEIHELNDRDMAQSWSIIRFLFEKYPKKGPSFFRLYNGKDVERTLRAVFKWTIADFERAWVEWADQF